MKKCVNFNFIYIMKPNSINITTSFTVYNAWGVAYLEFLLTIRIENRQHNA